MSTATDKPITTIIITHNHPDHVGRTDFFREKFPNVQVVAHENTKAWVEKNPRRLRRNAVSTQLARAQRAV